jgi:hypothetical protein
MRANVHLSRGQITVSIYAWPVFAGALRTLHQQGGKQTSVVAGVQRVSKHRGRKGM